jgi:hypothetical protein
LIRGGSMSADRSNRYWIGSGTGGCADVMRGGAHRGKVKQYCQGQNPEK